MSNGTQVVVSAVNPADLATKLKDATQVVQVPTGALSTIDWASKLKVSLCCHSVSGIVQLTLRFPWNNMFMSFQFSGNIFRVSYSNVWQLLTDSGLPIFMIDLNSWFHPCFVILVQKLPLNLLIMQQMTTGHWVDLEHD